METNEHTNRKPLVLSETDKIDTLDTFESTYVKASNIKPGMILIDSDDPIGFPAAVIDHRQRATRNSGCVRFLTEMLGEGLRSIELHANSRIRVAAR